MGEDELIEELNKNIMADTPNKPTNTKNNAVRLSDEEDIKSASEIVTHAEFSALELTLEDENRILIGVIKKILGVLNEVDANRANKVLIQIFELTTIINEHKALNKTSQLT